MRQPVLDIGSRLKVERLWRKLDETGTDLLCEGDGVIEKHAGKPGQASLLGGRASMGSPSQSKLPARAGLRPRKGWAWEPVNTWSVRGRPAAQLT